MCEGTTLYTRPLVVEQSKSGVVVVMGLLRHRLSSVSYTLTTHLHSHLITYFLRYVYFSLSLKTNQQTTKPVPLPSYS